MKTPFASFDLLKQIIKTHPTPFHLYDEMAIRKNVRRLRKAFAWNQGFKEYFAIKANPNPWILSILKKEGCGVDASSLTELLLSKATGFRRDEIIFSSNDTPLSDFELAAEMEAIINFDDITHIPFYEKIAKLPESVGCRFNPGKDFNISNAIMDSPEEAKYGFTKQQLFEGVALLQSKGVKRVGLHAFLASNTVSNEYYPALAKLLFETAVELHQKTGVQIAFINLSGGIGIPYHPGQKEADIELIGEEIKKLYYDIFSPHKMTQIPIFTELGRFILAPYGCLVTTVLHKKETYKKYIGVDACAADLIRPAMYKAYHHITVSGKENDPAAEMVDVTGGLCENNDKFAIDRMLPHIEIGDVLIIHDTGAHGHAMGYNYNGKLRSAELLLRTNGTVKQIRRSETPSDLFATLDFPGITTP